MPLQWESVFLSIGRNMLKITTPLLAFIIKGNLHNFFASISAHHFQFCQVEWLKGLLLSTLWGILPRLINLWVQPFPTPPHFWLFLRIPNSLKNIKKNPSQSERDEDALAWFTEKRPQPFGISLLLLRTRWRKWRSAIYIKIIVNFLSLSAERRATEGGYATTVQYYGAPAPMGHRRNHIPLEEA